MRHGLMVFWLPVVMISSQAGFSGWGASPVSQIWQQIVKEANMAGDNLDLKALARLAGVDDRPRFRPLKIFVGVILLAVSLVLWVNPPYWVN
jgi:hypothetical protein